MPDVTITIPQPILTGGQTFKVRYRSLSGGAWSAYSTRTNAAFTLTGLAVGDYQLETILVKADSTECAAVYQPFTVVAEYNCISFNSQIVKEGNLHYLKITYTLPGGFADPPCGWEVSYQQGSNKVTVPYPTLPTGGVIKLQLPNQSLMLSIVANLCNGKKKQCYSADVSGIPNPPCVPITITDKELVKDGDKWYLKFNFIQSTPATASMYIGYEQIHPFYMVPKGESAKIPAFAISAGQTQVLLQLNPTALSQYQPVHLVRYDVFVMANCGNFPFDVTHPI